MQEELSALESQVQSLGSNRGISQRSDVEQSILDVEARLGTLEGSLSDNQGQGM